MKSKRFLETQLTLVNNIDTLNDPDDLLLSYKLRNNFIDSGCTYGDKVGYRFSTEYGGYHNYNSFGFHDFRPNPQFKQLVKI